MKYKLGLAAVLLGSLTLAAKADISSMFVGFQTVDERGTSGAKSSYDYNSGGLYQSSQLALPGALPTFESATVDYPSVGHYPSPGYYYHDNGNEASHFDEGVLGVKVDGNNLVIRVASGMDPTKGYKDAYWKLLYGLGDMFVTVDDSAAGVKQFALLNTWATTNTGSLAAYGNDGRYNTAQSFHQGKDGYLVSLNSGSDMVDVGGTGSYSRSSNIEGLDTRVFAKSGTTVGAASLTFDKTTGLGIGNTQRDWFIETWTAPLSLFSSDNTFTLGLHTTTTCGNDQIGMVASISRPLIPGNIVPAPGAVVLGMMGLGLVGWFKRKMSL